MNSIVTPKHVLEIVLKGKTNPLSLCPWKNTTQKKLFILSVGSLIIGLILGALIQVWHEVVIGYFAISFLLLSIPASILYQLAILWPSLTSLHHSEKSLVDPVIAQFNDDIDTISLLVQDFKKHHLEYARDSLALVAQQTRARISLLVGALDKVGIIPLAITGYLSAKKLITDPTIQFSGIELVLAAFVALYLIAIHMLSVAQQIDRMVLVLKQASNAPNG